MNRKKIKGENDKRERGREIKRLWKNWREKEREREKETKT